MQAHGWAHRPKLGPADALVRSWQKKGERRVRSAATKPRTSAPCGISISTMDRSRCSLPAVSGCTTRAGRPRRPLAIVLSRPVVPLGDCRGPGARSLPGDPEAGSAACPHDRQRLSHELVEEVTEGLLRLGIVHERTLPYSPYQNGKQESFWGTLEGRLMTMLDGVAELTLDLLNQATQALVEIDYNRAVHRETKSSPAARLVPAPDVIRVSPSSESLRNAFRLEVKWSQRHSDGTISLEGCGSRSWPVSPLLRGPRALCAGI